VKFLVLVLMFATVGWPVHGKDRTADLVVTNANVRTMDAEKPRAEAFSVSGGEIIAVGRADDIKRQIGSDTRVIDARGRLVIPGFNDSHVHFMAIGNLFSYLDLSSAKSRKEMANGVARFARFLPKGRWILGGKWDHAGWEPGELPTISDIDAVSPDNPVLLYHRSEKIAIANSVALKMAGIDRNTRKFSDGVVERDEEGEPNGILRDAAISLVQRIVPGDHTRRWAEVAETASNHAASLGVTSVQDVHSDEMAEVYRELEREGRLKVRVYDCYSLLDWRKHVEMGVTKGEGMVRTGCLKGFADDDDELVPGLREAVSKSDGAGWHVTLHAIGRQENEVAIGAIENALRGKKAADRRFRIEHAEGLDDAAMRRVEKAEIIASVQPYLFGGRASYYKQLQDAGIRLAFGSDAPMSAFDPLLGIHAAVAGSWQFGVGAGAMSIEDAVRAYTVGSAYAEFQEDRKGSITPGKLADFVILSEDIFSIKPEDIRRARVLLTVVGGRVVYESL
jgi:predicted amidohydrolase YtcJ